MPSNSHTRRRWFVCDNTSCLYVGVLRFVDPIRLPGAALYTIGAVMCECQDIELRRVEGPTEPTSIPLTDISVAYRDHPDWPKDEPRSAPDRSWATSASTTEDIRDQVKAVSDEELVAEARSRGFRVLGKAM